MGLTFRKTISLGGGSRVNLSGSGIGFSTGVKGFRVSTGPRGTYINVGAHGIHYREKIAGPYGFPNERKTVSDAEIVGKEQLESDVDTLELVTEDAASILEKINAKTNQPVTWIAVTCWAFFLSFFVMAGLMGLSFWLNSLEHPAKGIGAWETVAILIFSSKIIFVPTFTYVCGKIAANYDTARRTYHIEYDLDETGNQRFLAVEKAVGILAQNESLSYIYSIIETTDRKRNAGSGRVDGYREAKIEHSQPPLLETNVTPLCLDLGKQSKRLYFMPDRIYIYQEVDGCAVEYGAVEYDALQLEYQAQRIILDKETAPSDTEVVDKTFAKVNKDGSQDLRFKYNPELPICLMGLLTLKSSQGLNILLEVSRASTVREFTEAFHLAVSSFPNPDKLVNSSNKDVSIKWDNPPLIINSSAQSTSHPEELVEGGYLPCPHCGYLNTPLDKQCNRCNAQLTNFFEDKEIA